MLRELLHEDRSIHLLLLALLAVVVVAVVAWVQ